jgi:hypothetical protein
MTAKFKTMRTAGAVPPGYDGPVYWRVMEYHLVRGASGEPLEFTDSRERRDRLWIDRYKMPGKDIFTAGTVFDASGQILPEWREPIKARWTKPGPVRVEFYPSIYSARVSERVWAVMEALEPGRHHAFPIDILCTDGTIERRYEVFFARDALVGGREMHPEANDLKPATRPEGLFRYQAPMWLSEGTGGEDRFGYLDQSVVGGMHWFKGTDTNQYFSPELFAQLKPLGDIFPKWDVVLPVGLAGQDNFR